MASMKLPAQTKIRHTNYMTQKFKPLHKWKLVAKLISRNAFYRIYNTMDNVVNVMKVGRELIVLCQFVGPIALMVNVCILICAFVTLVGSEKYAILVIVPYASMGNAQAQNTVSVFMGMKDTVVIFQRVILHA